MSVFIDPDAPPSHRYRATICTGWSHEGLRDENLGVYGFYTVHSADGLSWEYDKRSPQWYHADCITNVYHPGQKRAMVMLKANPLQTVNGMRRRAFMASEFADGKWSDEANPALVPDEFDDVAAKRTVMESGYALVGLARWPKWRLFGFRADPRGKIEINLGRLTEASRLYVNYRTWRGGSARAEILHGRFTDFYANPDMKPSNTSRPLTGDSLAEEVSWESGGPIHANPDEDCVARLHLDRAEVYAYEVRPAKES